MYGVHILDNAIQLLTRRGNSINTDNIVWSDGGNKGQRWESAAVTVNNIESDTRVSIDFELYFIFEIVYC